MMRNYERNLKRIAIDITYDDFVGLVLFQYDDRIVDVKSIDNQFAIWCWEYYSGRTLLVFITNNNDDGYVRELYDNDTNHNTRKYVVWSFNNISLRVSALDYLFKREFDIRHIPPNLISLKYKIEKELDTLLDCGKKESLLEAFRNNYDSSVRYLCLDAETILEQYRFHLLSNQMPLFWWNYLPEKPVRINNIDNLRGMELEQKALGKYIQTYCKGEFKCEIELWAMDSGFEVLSDSISGLVNDGKVNLILYSQKKNQKIYGEKNKIFYGMEKFFTEG